MPIFEYLCCDCAEEFEVVVSGKEPEKCPYCNGEIKKLVSLPSKPKFVGPGFYENDYKKK